MEQNLADADVPVEDKMDILKNFEKKEMEYMRLQRKKMGVDDFELLNIIGRGAFGEVLLLLFNYVEGELALICYLLFTLIFRFDIVMHLEFGILLLPLFLDSPSVSN